MTAGRIGADISFSERDRGFCARGDYNKVLEALKIWDYVIRACRAVEHYHHSVGDMLGGFFAHLDLGLTAFVFAQHKRYLAVRRSVNELCAAIEFSQEVPIGKLGKISSYCRFADMKQIGERLYVKRGVF